MSLINTASLAPHDHHDEQDQIYNGLDACVTLEVCEELLSEQPPAIYDFERALQGPILDLMLRGFRIDEFERQRALSELKQSCGEVWDALQRLAKAVWDKGELNPLSHKQLTQFFFTTMRLPETWTSKKGVRKLSLDREALEKLDAYLYARPIIAAILSYRDLSKLAKTIETEVDSDGRWRTSYNIGGTETGRLSSSKSAWGTGSNTQNLRQDDKGDAGLPSIRRMFIADKGYKLGNIDLEQTESFDVGWLHGVLLGDWTYLDACERGDLHTQVSRMVWPQQGWTGDLARDRVIAEQPFYRHFSYRDMAKRGGHLTNYLGTAWTAARTLKVPIRLMEQFQAAYATGANAAFPAFPKWWRWVAQELQTSQRLTTPFGRERYFFGRPRDDATLREAVAFVPQSTTADRMNLGMWRIWKHMGGDVQLLAQVHDSVCFQFREDLDEREIITEALRLTRVTQRTAGRSMTVKAEAKVGWNWGTYDARHNPNGMLKWSPQVRDKRERILTRTL